jgi:DNA adenine methylase
MAYPSHANPNFLEREGPIAVASGVTFDCLSALNCADLSLNVRTTVNQRAALAEAIVNAPDEALALAERLALARPRRGFARAEASRRVPPPNLALAVGKILHNPVLLQGLRIPKTTRRRLAHLAAAFIRRNPRRKRNGESLRQKSRRDCGDEALAGTRLHVTPLRYPGGKGKLAAFIKTVIETNDLLDAEYCEPYAGGAAIALELLLQEYVRRVHINDISFPIYAFWDAVLNDTETFVRLVRDTPLSVRSWDRQKAIFKHQGDHSSIELGFATFFLNRTNRSGILNAGIIGGRCQTSKWTIEARYNLPELIRRIETIASYRNRILLTRMDALKFLPTLLKSNGKRVLIYLDPPYYAKGKDLYYDYYEHDDHEKIASFVQTKMRTTPWVVSYDNVSPIRTLYRKSRGVAYRLPYSARSVRAGAEIMFFSESLYVPQLVGGVRPLVGGSHPIRSVGFQPRARERAVMRSSQMER